MTKYNNVKLLRQKKNVHQIVKSQGFNVVFYNPKASLGPVVSFIAVLKAKDMNLTS